MPVPAQIMHSSAPRLSSSPPRSVTWLPPVKDVFDFLLMTQSSSWARPSLALRVLGTSGFRGDLR